MADPTLEDILDRIEDVYDKVKDVFEKVSENKNLLDELLNPLKGNIIWQSCYACDGNGIMYNVNGMLLPIQKEGATPMVCPYCKGTKKELWGWKSNNSEDLPAGE